MAENNPPKKPPFASVDELVEYFDSGGDMSEYLDSMPEVHFDVDLKRRTRLVAVDAELAEKIGEIAQERNISAEALLDSWLREKLQQAS